MSLTRLFPQPARVTLAGDVYSVAELRVRDLAAIQGWIEAHSADPLAIAALADADPDPESRMDGLRAAWKLARDWPPVFGATEAAELTARPAFRYWFTWLVLSRTDPAFTPDRAIDLAVRMTVEEHLALSRAAWRPEPARAVSRLIDPESESRGAPIDWEELVAELVAQAPWELAKIGDLPISALLAVLRGGKPPRATVECDLEGEAFVAFMERRRRLFYGDPTPNNDGAAEPVP